MVLAQIFSVGILAQHLFMAWMAHVSPNTHQVEGFKESSKEKAGSVYSAAKGNVYDVKERGEKAAAKAGEYLDSVTKGSDEYMKRPAERSVEEASRRKETLAEKMEDVTTAHANERVREALRNAGEAAVEKFREAMDESYRLSSDGAHVLREATRKAEKEFHSLLSEEDTKMQMEGPATTTSEAAMDAAANLSRDLSSKGARHVVWMHKSWSHPEPLRGITRLIHLFCFSTIYGTSIWLTFLAGHVLAAAIPRQQFGWVQSKMYPVYFKTMAYGLAICLVGHTLVHPWLSATKTEKWQTCNLFLSLLFTLLNIFYLEPRATKVMFERLKMEKEEGRGRDVGEINHPLSNNNTSNGAEDANCKMLGLNNRLKVLHRYSSIVNVLSLMCLTWHMAYLSSKINM